MKKTFQTTARGWVDGSTQTLAAQAFRTAATLVSLPYSGVVRLRNRLFDWGVLRVSKPPRPTISVGNLTLGGVGKTPFVGWLAEYFLQNAQTPAFISRGYQAERQRELFARVDAQNTQNTQNTQNLNVAQTFLSERLKSQKYKTQNTRNAQNAQPPLSVQPSNSSQPSRSLFTQFAQFQHFNDEARELALRFPSTPHFLGSRRAEVAAALVEARPDVDVLLLDDAFQHRRIARDLDVVLLDALNPFGGGRVFPSGFLREPLVGLARADVVLLNRADLVSAERRRAIRAQVERFNRDALFAEIAQIPQLVFSRRFPDDANVPNGLNVANALSSQNVVNSLADANVPNGLNVASSLNGVNVLGVQNVANSSIDVNELAGLNDANVLNGASATFAPPCPTSLFCEEFATWAETRRGSRFLAFCGLGAPSGFRKTLENNGLEPVSFVAFPDHCAYSADDFATLAAEAERIDADAILTTAKDFVKLPEATLAGRPIFALGIGVEFLSGEPALRALLFERFPVVRRS